MADKKSFILHHDSLGILDKIDDEQAGKLFKAIRTYSATGQLDCDLITELLIHPFQMQLERDQDKWNKIAERNRNNGSKGGRPANPKKPKQPTGFSGIPKEPKEPVSVSGSVNESVSGSDSERKEKHTPGKPNNDALQILCYLNEIRRSNFKPVASNMKLINARLSEGHSLQEINDVVLMKSKEWDGDPKMEKFIRPATLFNAEKFNQYVGDLPAYHREQAGEVDWLPVDNEKDIIEGVIDRG